MTLPDFNKDPYPIFITFKEHNVEKYLNFRIKFTFLDKILFINIYSPNIEKENYINDLPPECLDDKFQYYYPIGTANKINSFLYDNKSSILIKLNTNGYYSPVYYIQNIDFPRCDTSDSKKNKTKITKFSSLINLYKSHHPFLFNHILSTLNSSGKISNRGNLILNNKFSYNDISSFFISYYNKYILCPFCHSNITELITSPDDYLTLHCFFCDNSISL